MKSIFQILTVIALLIPTTVHARPIGSYTISRIKVVAPPSIPQHKTKAMDLSNSTDICLLENGTWHSTDGTLQGGWTMVGNQLSLSGNSNTVGVSSILNVFETNVSLVGSWDTWSISAPTEGQELDRALLTKKSDACQ